MEEIGSTCPHALTSALCVGYSTHWDLGSHVLLGWLAQVLVQVWILTLWRTPDPIGNRTLDRLRAISFSPAVAAFNSFLRGSGIHISVLRQGGE
jgi:hypothetical protein